MIKMGFMKQAKAASVGADALRAREEGHTIFVAQLHPGSWSTAQKSGSAGDVAEMIESVESAGWTLAFAPSFVARADGSKMTAYCPLRPAQPHACSPARRAPS